MKPQQQWKICLSDLTYDDQEQAAVAEVLRSRWLTMGPRKDSDSYLFPLALPPASLGDLEWEHKADHHECPQGRASVSSY